MKRQKKLYFSGIVALIAIAGIYAAVGTNTDSRKEHIEEMFSPVNGEHLKITRFVKENLQDPGSYKNVETNYWDMDTAIIVNQKYSSLSEAGTRVTGFIKATVDEDGNIIKILEQR